MSETNYAWKWCDFTAGCVAGVAGIAIGHPMDTVKVRQQTFGETSGMKLAHNTLKYEGIGGFYKGMMFPAISAGALNSIFFGVYANTLQILQEYRGISDDRRTCAEGTKPVHKYWHLDVYLAGCVAGMAQVSVGCPIDIIKIQLQAQTGTKQFRGAGSYDAGHTGAFSCVKNMYKDNGFRGFYRGFHAMVWRDVPTFGLYILAYEHSLSFGRPATDTSADYSVARQIIAGGLAGVISWQVVLPLDVVKSRLQADNPKAPVYSGMIDCFVKSYKADGISVFGRGFWLVSIRAFVVNAGLFVAFEWCLAICNKITQVIPAKPGK